MVWWSEFKSLLIVIPSFLLGGHFISLCEIAEDFSAVPRENTSFLQLTFLSEPGI